MIAGPDTAPPRDGRTVAILSGSVPFLESIGVWEAVRAHAAPLAEMQIVDDTGSLFRLPPVRFKAAEIAREAFGYNIELADLAGVLASAARSEPALSWIDAAVERFERLGDGAVVATLSTNKTVRARRLIGADGRQSPVRAFARIGTKEWRYPQTALTALFSHRRDHCDASTEFHTRSGPFTLVPLPGRRSSLVWMMDEPRAEAMAAAAPAAFEAAAERQAHSLLGAMRLEGTRGLVPMSGLSVDRYASDGVALVGEAAHVFPPIGAQGLNLGLRDAAALVKAVKSPGGDPLFAAYDASRRADILGRTFAVDMLNRSLLRDFLPVDFARGAGLLAISTIPPLRKIAMRLGAGDQGPNQGKR